MLACVWKRKSYLGYHENEHTRERKEDTESIILSTNVIEWRRVGVGPGLGVEGDGDGERGTKREGVCGEGRRGDEGKVLCVCVCVGREGWARCLFCNYRSVGAETSLIRQVLVGRLIIFKQ